MGVAGAYAVAAADPWSRLHRPLHLPTLASGASCPVSRASSFNFKRYGVATGVGPGPAYPIGFAQPGSVLPVYEISGSVWRGGKALWFVAPSYRGRVLIRGRRLDAPGIIRFDRGSALSNEIRINIGQRGGNPPDQVWAGQRYRPSLTRVLNAGCYAYQIDGSSFSRVIVLVAEQAP